MINKIKKFYKNVEKEMKIVTWPNKYDIKEGTTVVITISVIVALFLFGVDSIFSVLFRFLFS